MRLRRRGSGAVPGAGSGGDLRLRRRQSPRPEQGHRAADALRQTGRTEIIIANHYFSNELLTYMSQPNSLILASTDTPWHILGTKTGELAVRMARGKRIPPTTYFVPVTFIEKKDAATTLADVKRMDSEVIALLKHYGG